MMKKGSLFLIFVMFLITLIFLTSAQELPQTQADCENANAEWRIISPENGETTSICVCEEYNSIGIQDKFWNGTSCINYNGEIRCEKSNGVWEGNKCTCENGEWVEGVGCQFAEHDNPILIYLIISLVVLIVILFILILFTKRRKRI